MLASDLTAKWPSCRHARTPYQTKVFGVRAGICGRDRAASVFLCAPDPRLRRVLDYRPIACAPPKSILTRRGFQNGTGSWFRANSTYHAAESALDSATVSARWAYPLLWTRVSHLDDSAHLRGGMGLSYADGRVLR